MRIVIGLLLLLSLSCGTFRQSASEREARLNAGKADAAVLLQSQRYEAALESLEALSSEVTGDSQVFVMLGDAHAGLGAFDQAVAAYEQAIRLAYGNHNAHLKLATLLVEHGKTGRALTEFELAVKYGARDPLSHYNYGLALYEMGRRDEAVEQWREAWRKAPSEPKYAEAYGIGLSGKDDAAAAEAFRDAKRLGADGASFHNNYGLVLLRLERYAEAAQEFQAATQRDPKSEEYRFNLAALFLRSGQTDRAADAFAGLGRDFGDHWSYRVYRADAVQTAGKNDEAVALLDSVTAEIESGQIRRDSQFVDRMPPGVAQALEILARARRGQGNLEAALELIERAIALDPGNTSLLNNYGVILAENGMLARAKQQWRKVLEIDAGNAAAQRNLSQYTP